MKLFSVFLVTLFCNFAQSATLFCTSKDGSIHIRLNSKKQILEIKKAKRDFWESDGVTKVKVSSTKANTHVLAGIDGDNARFSVELPISFYSNPSSPNTCEATFRFHNMGTDEEGISGLIKKPAFCSYNKKS